MVEGSVGHVQVGARADEDRMKRPYTAACDIFVITSY